MNHGRCTAIKLARVASGMRLMDVERVTGINQSLLARIEKGDAAVTRAQVDKLAAAFGIESAVLLGRVPFQTLCVPPIVT